MACSLDAVFISLLSHLGNNRAQQRLTRRKVSKTECFDGRLDVFVENSGVSWGDEAFIDSDVGRYHDLMEINTDGVVYCAPAAGRHFRRQKQEGTTINGSKFEIFDSGSFIATASMSGHIVNIPRR
ncbi:uncharacterized protein FFB20_15929 [Fusarium fujikuroi]|nr:uncharacterized protein FFC1_02213 [Fusarium fujikuroi]SCO20396.1 uncharacterized protein FFB20_15929 [Fusarium fujikuroi]SCO24631.1 uncharacterized protein FFE2_16024 [Fusarium fujikuroi]SCV54224.1 uncharacterized protein FFFS_11155 [Fusarium fujikuroi]